MKNDSFHGQTALLLTIIVLVLAAELLVLTACGGDELQSHRPPAAMVIDGQWSDWEEIPIHRVEEMNGLVLGVANDDGYLYLMARSTDVRMVRRLRMLGIVVEASGQGKEGSELHVCYHGSVQLSDSLAKAGGGPGDGRMPSPFETGDGPELPAPGMIEIEQGGTITRVAENRPDGIAAGSAAGGDVYCYEYRLPLADLFAGPLPEGGVNGRIVSLEVESGDMTDEMRQQMMQQGGGRGGGMGGGMGGGRGGGMGGGRGGGMGGPGGMQGSGGRDPDPKKLQVTIKLAGAA